MDILIEILLEIYMELMMLVVPEKRITKAQRRIAVVIAVCVIVGVFALFIWGMALILDHGNMWGILPVAAAVLISLVQIVAGILLYRKNH